MSNFTIGRRFEVRFKEILFRHDPVMGEYVATRAICSILLWKATPEQDEVRLGDEVIEQLQYGKEHGNFLSSHPRYFYFEAKEIFNISRLQEIGQKSATITPA